MQELIGKTIVGMSISADAQFLVFNTNEGEVAYYAEGDCCSNSWFENISGVNNVGQVISVADINMPEPDQGDHECLRAYGIRIATNIGHIIIEYRNSSNGYYGGWCEFYDYALPDKINLRKLTEDM